MRDCDKFKLSISEYVDGQLTGEEKDAVEAHLKSCKKCQQLAQNLRALKGALRNLAPVRTSTDFDAMLRANIRIRNKSQWRRPNSRREVFMPWRIPAYALGIISIVIIAFVSINLMQQHQSAPLATSQQNSAAQVSSTDDSARVFLNYVLDQIPLEQLVSNRAVQINSKNAPTRQSSVPDSVKNQEMQRRARERIASQSQTVSF